MVKVPFAEQNLPSDEALFAQIAAGDTQAFSMLYDRYSSQLFGLALKIMQNQSLAEDVIQDVFMTIWKKAGSYKKRKGKPLGWMMILCRNRCIDLLRKQQKQNKKTSGGTEKIDALAADSDLPDPLEQASVAELSYEITKAMGQLPPEQRQLIDMAYFQGFSQSEISRTLKVPLGTVKTRIRLGMQKLRDTLKEKWNI